MCDLSKLMLTTALCHEEITKLRDWLNDQNLVAKTAHQILDHLDGLVNDLHNVAKEEFTV